MAKMNPLFTLTEFANGLRIRKPKALAWIRRGELKAINVAGNPAGPPRYMIAADEAVRFMAARATTPAALALHESPQPVAM